MSRRIVWVAVLITAWAAWSTAGAQAQVRYIHTDALGSVVAVTNEQRVVIERREYEPYGHQLTPAVADGPGYTGHVQDAATGLTYMQQRYYDPQLGVFLSTDPVTAYDHPLSAFHRYRYANGNPFSFIDPDGRMACSGTPECRNQIEQLENRGIFPFQEGSGSFKDSLPPLQEGVYNSRTATSVGDIYHKTVIGTGNYRDDWDPIPQWAWKGSPIDPSVITRRMHPAVQVLVSAIMPEHQVAMQTGFRSRAFEIGYQRAQQVAVEDVVQSVRPYPSAPIYWAENPEWIRMHDQPIRRLQYRWCYVCD